jgi:membrane protein required for colicin V production
LIQFASFFVAIIAAFKLKDWGAVYVEKYVSQDGLPQLIALVVIFIVVVLALNILGHLLKKLLNLTLLGSLDDLAGAIIGVLKWALTISIFVWLFTFFEIEMNPEFIESSVIYPYIAAIAPYLFDTFSFLGPIFKEFFDNGKELIKPKEQQAFVSSLLS